MSKAIAWCFLIGFGLEVGGTIASCIWPETEAHAYPLICIGAGMMTFAVFAPDGRKENRP